MTPPNFTPDQIAWLRKRIRDSVTIERTCGCLGSSMYSDTPPQYFLRFLGIRWGSRYHEERKYTEAEQETRLQECFSQMGV